MNGNNEKTKSKPISETANPEHLLKEYELCWQGIQHHNTRVWNSASVFLAGSVVAITWIATKLFEMDEWVEFCSIAIVALVICAVLYSYLRIFYSWVLLDRVEFYRAEEIEKFLKLWRIRYRLLVRCDPSKDDTTEETKRINLMRKMVAKRMKIKLKKLPKYTANLYFQTIIYLIISASILLFLLGLLIML